MDRHGKNYSESEKQYILDHYFTTTLKEIASHMGRSEHSVRNQCRKLGLRKRREHMTPELERAVKKASLTMGRTEVMTEFGVSKNQLGYRQIRFRRMGEKHCWSKYPDSLVEECRSLFDSGMRVSEIARKFGIHYMTVKSWIHFECRTGIFIDS
jgi:transposase-like protein